MRVARIDRYPIKSLLGESLGAVTVQARGLDGDRLWAVRDPDGKLGSGKNSARFRRMPGLLDLRGHGGRATPLVELPDGRRFAADDPAGHAAVSALLGRPVTIGRETDVKHHDDGPVSIVTTAALRRLGDLLGDVVDPVRFRANLLVDVPGVGFPEDGWVGRHVRVGPDVVLLPVERLPRCVMIDMETGDLPEHGALLRILAAHHDRCFGVWANVVRPGRIAVDDAVTVTAAPSSPPPAA
jgi:uncharacterized protein YcbX